VDPNALTDADLVAAGKRLAGRVRGEFETAYRQAQRIADERERNGVMVEVALQTFP
jgi:hypothetical protein